MVSNRLIGFKCTGYYVVKCNWTKWLIMKYYFPSICQCQSETSGDTNETSISKSNTEHLHEVT